MKAKKIVPRIIGQSQEQVEAEALAAATKADARRKRELNRSNRLFFSQIFSGLANLDPVDCCASRRNEIISGLFDIIAEAQKAVLRLARAPGIISQRELQLFNSSGSTALRELWWKELVAHVRDGWKVEPGPWFMCSNHVGLNVGHRKAGASYTPQLERRATPAPRLGDSQTPSADTLQAWFDLPSEPRQAEGSPSES